MSRLRNYINEEKENSNDDVKAKIMDFLAKNPSPNDEKVHNFADSLGIETDEFEAMFYGILGSVLGAGKAKEKKFTEKDADAKELKMGMEVEMEHTTNKAIAKRIALDHLAEIPDYYTRLKKMEAEAGIKD